VAVVANSPDLLNNLSGKKGLAWGYLSPFEKEVAGEELKAMC
jgi:putative NADH-flavin reductase